MIAPLKRRVKPLYKKIRSILEKPKKPNSTKLHLGCGNRRIEGWCNIDISETGFNDLRDDISKLKLVDDNFADKIYACHVLEHFAHDEVPPLLKIWYSKMAQGGELRISVPDLDRIVSIYSRNPKHFNTKGHTPWIGLIYGGQCDQYDFHKTGFNFCWLSKLLEDAGFINIEEYPHAPHFAGIDDASLANQPFGEYISLNIKAYKP
jgi:predicted SAM-dependent methyltransferase